MKVIFRAVTRHLALLAALAGILAAACTASVATGPSPAMLPTFLPMPADAVVIVGTDGPGYDAGAQVYGFSSELSPAQTLARYVEALGAAGYAAAGTDATWHLFRGRGYLIAVQVGSSGPPTDLVVRIQTEPTSPPATGNPGNGNSGGNGKPTSPPGNSNAGGNGKAGGQPSSPLGNSNAGGNGKAGGQPSSPPGNGAPSGSQTGNGNAGGNGKAGGQPSSPPGNSNAGGNGKAGGQPSSPPGQSNAGGQPSGPPGQGPAAPGGPSLVPQPDPPHAVPTAAPAASATTTPSSGKASASAGVPAHVNR